MVAKKTSPPLYFAALGIRYPMWCGYTALFLSPSWLLWKGRQGEAHVTVPVACLFLSISIVQS